MTFKSTPNNAPNAVDDIGMVKAGKQVGIRVLNNDSDPDGDDVRIKFSQTDRVSKNGGTIKWNRNGTPDDFSDDKLVYKAPKGLLEKTTLAMLFPMAEADMILLM